VVEVPTEKPLGRLRGVVLEQGNEGVVVADAHISFPGRQLNAISARADGSFETYTLEPGDVQLALEAAGYEPGNCAGAIPVAGGDVTVSCVMHALPRVGAINVSVTDETGAAVPGAAVLLTGPDTRSVVSDASGHARAENLAPGNYHARVDQTGYLLANSAVDVQARKDTNADVRLVHTPKSAAVVISKDKIKLKGTVLFATGTAQIEGASNALLTELADTLQRHPEILRVEVQGHTDDRGDAATNLSLSQSRADAVKTWLVQNGVEADRLVTKGMGAERPLAPNLSEYARAKNRRVELAILSRAGQ
jgi:outer membrane protein OmpA-like peptidoglycan-associated protein